MPAADFDALVPRRSAGSFRGCRRRSRASLCPALRHARRRAAGGRPGAWLISAATSAALFYEREARFLLRAEWARSAEDILDRRTKHGLHLSAGERAAFERLAVWLERSGAGAACARRHEAALPRHRHRHQRRARLRRRRRRNASSAPPSVPLPPPRQDGATSTRIRPCGGRRPAMPSARSAARSISRGLAPGHRRHLRHPAADRCGRPAMHAGPDV